MEGTIQITGITLDEFWAEMDRRYGVKETTKQTPSDAQYSTIEAMEALKIKTHVSFKKYLKEHKIQPYRRSGNTKYYLHADLFKKQSFK